MKKYYRNQGVIVEFSSLRNVWIKQSNPSEVFPDNGGRPAFFDIGEPGEFVYRQTVAVAGSNSRGDSELHVTEVYVSNDERKRGLHRKLATQSAREAGLVGDLACFTEGSLESLVQKHRELAKTTRDGTYLVIGYHEESDCRYADRIAADSPYEAQLRAVLRSKLTSKNTGEICPVAVVNQVGELVDEEQYTGLGTVDMGGLLTELVELAVMTPKALSSDDSILIDYLRKRNLDLVNEQDVFDLDAPLSKPILIEGVAFQHRLLNLARKLFAPGTTAEAVLTYISETGDRINNLRF